MTTALLRGVRYLKDNRLLPDGFDKGTVDEAVAVQGVAAADADFTGRGDRVRYRLEVDDGVTAVTVTARLLFQTIGYRWARNLADYDAFETNRLGVGPRLTRIRRPFAAGKGRRCRPGSHRSGRPMRPDSTRGRIAGSGLPSGKSGSLVRHRCSTASPTA